METQKQQRLKFDRTPLVRGASRVTSASAEPTAVQGHARAEASRSIHLTLPADYRHLLRIQAARLTLALDRKITKGQLVQLALDRLFLAHNEAEIEKLVRLDSQTRKVG